MTIVASPSRHFINWDGIQIFILIVTLLSRANSFSTLSIWIGSPWLFSSEIHGDLSIIGCPWLISYGSAQALEGKEHSSFLLKVGLQCRDQAMDLGVVQGLDSMY